MKYNFTYKLITTKGETIESTRKFKSRRSAEKILNKLYPGCAIIHIKSENAGDIRCNFKFLTV